MESSDEYIDYVISKAREIGKEFVIDSGEGNDCADNEYGWYIENLSGWLVDVRDVEAVKAAKLEQVTDKFSNSYVFAYWGYDAEGKLSIRFEYAPNYDL
ncbi:hypothetical protein NST04_09310 [Paenibacillus sp. FSL H7-0756]|uniref:hypothetical protein n=1 Tax=Paenibacillus sp. FSL H7-0756 TaxID=2954738 RepID=UPI0030F6CEC3